MFDEEIVEVEPSVKRSIAPYKNETESIQSKTNFISQPSESEEEKLSQHPVNDSSSFAGLESEEQNESDLFVAGFRKNRSIKKNESILSRNKGYNPGKV